MSSRTDNGPGSYDEKGKGAFLRAVVILLENQNSLFPNLADYQNYLGNFSTVRSSLSLEISLH